MTSLIPASQLEQLKALVLPQAEQIRDAVMQKVLPGLKKNKYSCLAAAIVLYVTARTYKFIAYPSSLRHIKRVPFHTQLISLIKGENNLVRSEKFMLASWKETNGFMGQFNQLGWGVVLSNPEAIRTLLYKTDLFPKAPTGSAGKKTLLARFFGRTNMAFTSGHEWRRRRKIANPAFHRSMPVKTFGFLSQRMLEQVDKVEGPVHIQPLLQRFTLDAIGLIGFGFEFNATNTPDGEWVRRYNDVVEHFLDFKFLLLPQLDSSLLWLFPERRAKHESMTKLNELFEEVIQHKKAALSNTSSDVEDSEKDLLTLMLEAGQGDDSNEALTSEELRNELVLFFVAGHDTTSNALTGTLYYLAANPDIQDKARKEVFEIFGDEKSNISPTLDQLKELTYLTLVMKESSRIAPPATQVFPRVAVEDTELCGVPIPKGTRIGIDITGMHFNPYLWKDPLKFIPERFAPGGELESMPCTYAYLPFGGGSRQCIGMNFSLAEQRVALSAILHKYELSLPEDSIHKDGLKFGKNAIVLSTLDLHINFKRRY
ncbi:cytochrome P450 [Umbelopsis sp. PMI_123]|nr:cytochrome P450 [Umbelopsis sp. PMI_123]